MPSGSTTFATISRALKASPAIPTPLNGFAAISPATNVPCPCSSWYGEPPTNERAATTRPTRSGCSPSIPESITATLTGASVGGVGQKSHAWSRVEVPLLRGERLGVVERGGGRRRDERERRSERERDADVSRHASTAIESPGCEPGARCATHAVVARRQRTTEREGAGGVGRPSTRRSSTCRCRRRCSCDRAGGGRAHRPGRARRGDRSRHSGPRRRPSTSPARTGPAATRYGRAELRRHDRGEAPVRAGLERAGGLPVLPEGLAPRARPSPRRARCRSDVAPP